MNDVNLPVLTPRMAAIASLARYSKRIADIGTDHAYIPVYLTLKGISPFSVASDIKEGPLKKAKETINKFCAVDKVQTVLCDGLSGIDSETVDDIIIAGMGGEMISGILEGTPWVHKGDRRLILQPMTNIPKLRKYLYENNFVIEAEKLEKEGKKLYVVIVVKSGIPLKPQLIDLILGPRIKLKNGEIEKEYLNSLIMRYKKALGGIKRAESERDKHKIHEFEEIIDALNEHKREWEI